MCWVGCRLGGPLHPTWNPSLVSAALELGEWRPGLVDPGCEPGPQTRIVSKVLSFAPFPSGTVSRSRCCRAAPGAQSSAEQVL